MICGSKCEQKLSHNFRNAETKKISCHIYSIESNGNCFNRFDHFRIAQHWMQYCLVQHICCPEVAAEISTVIEICVLCTMQIMCYQFIWIWHEWRVNLYLRSVALIGCRGWIKRARVRFNLYKQETTCLHWTAWMPFNHRSINSTNIINPACVWKLYGSRKTVKSCE